MRFVIRLPGQPDIPVPDRIADNLSIYVPGCEMDGTWEDSRGGEHYWHCERPAVTTITITHLNSPPYDLRVCQEHADEEGAP